MQGAPGTMANEELVMVKELYDRLEAEIASAALRAHGIESVISGEGLGLAFPVNLGSLGRIDLRVRRQDAARAKDILDGGPLASGD